MLSLFSVKQVAGKKKSDKLVDIREERYRSMDHQLRDADIVLQYNTVDHYNACSKFIAIVQL